MDEEMSTWTRQMAGMQQQNGTVENGHVADEHGRRGVSQRFLVDHDEGQEIAEKSANGDERLNEGEDVIHLRHVLDHFATDDLIRTAGKQRRRIRDR